MKSERRGVPAPSWPALRGAGTRMGARLSGGRALAVLLMASALLVCSCSRGALRSPAGGAGGGALPVRPIENADSLRSALLPLVLPEAALPAALSASATTRLLLGEKRLPGLTLRLTVQEGAGVSAMLRPGMLSPVAILWAAADRWQIRFPRQRVCVESRGTTPPGAVGRVAGPAISGALLTRLGWYLLVPQSILVEMLTPRATARGGAYVLNGTLAGLAEFFPEAEICVDAATGAIEYWSLRDGRGHLQLAVSYSPARKDPVSGGAIAGRLDLQIPQLDLYGGVILSRVRGHDEREFDHRPCDSTWEQLEAEDLPALLEQLVEPEARPD